METIIINREHIFSRLVQVDETIRQLRRTGGATSRAQHKLLDRLRRHYCHLLLARAYQDHSY